MQNTYFVEQQQQQKNPSQTYNTNTKYILNVVG